MEMKKEDLHCKGRCLDPQHQLLQAFMDQNLETFKTILTDSVRDSSINLDYWYEGPHHGTMLDIIHRTKPFRHAFHLAMCQAGADKFAANKRNDETLIYAIESKNLELFKDILNNPNADPNISDNNGNWIIHLAAELQDIRFLEKLLGPRPYKVSPKVDINRVNGRGQTALHITAQYKNEDSSLKLINAGIDLDSLKDTDGHSGRDMLLLHLPHLGSKPGYTLLQYACEKGLHEVVESYLREGGSPNGVGAENKKHPLIIAGFRGYSNIIRIFTQHKDTKYTLDDKGNNIFHHVLMGMSEYMGSVENIDENRDYHECIKILLQVPWSQLNINCQNNQGNTPLHYAARHGDPKVIVMLLSSGANVNLRNRDDDSPLPDIGPKVFEMYLDLCLTSNGPFYKNNHYLSFSYRFVEHNRIKISKNMPSLQVELDVDSNNDKSANTDIKTPGTDLLLDIAHSPRFRHLLKHPILSFFIYLRWQRIKRLFWMNLAFYLVFCIFLNVYIIQMHKEIASSSKNNSHTNNGTIIPEDFEKSSGEGSFFRWIWFILVIVTLFMLIVRELFQFLVSPSTFMSSPDNWLEAGIILCTTLILLGNESIIQKISPIAILLSWADLILLIGRYPFMSNHIQMFKRVSWNFLELFSWYSILIIAFSLSFCILFGDNTDTTLFSNPWISTFKTVIMITGEFDSSSLNLNENPIVSHVVFVSFVFLIAIVLFNLLNGLAVSDIQAIKADAELVSFTTQIKLISYIEKIMLGDSDSYKGILRNIKPLSLYSPYFIRFCTRLGCFKTFSEQSNLFSFLNSSYKVRIYPNQKNKVQYCVQDFDYDFDFRNGYDDYDNDDERLYTSAILDLVDIDPSIVNAAREILTRREEEKDLNRFQKKIGKTLVEYERRFELNEHQLAVVRSSSKKTESMLQELLDLMKRNK